MKLTDLRNLAFVAMTFGGVCLGAVDSRADGSCENCTNSGSTGKCVAAGQGSSGWTQCDDSSNCSVWGGQCTGA